jgi:hypothetical protein
VGAIEVPVHPLGGENFKITLNATALAVGEANAEMSCVQGTERARQELYRVAVAVRADLVERMGEQPVHEEDRGHGGSATVDEDGVVLVGGEVVAMAVKERPPLL